MTRVTKPEGIDYLWNLSSIFSPLQFVGGGVLIERQLSKEKMFAQSHINFAPTKTRIPPSGRLEIQAEGELATQHLPVDLLLIEAAPAEKGPSGTSGF